MNQFKTTLDTMSKGMDWPRDICWAIYKWMSVETRWDLFRALFPQPKKGNEEFKRICNWCFRGPISWNCYICQNYYCKSCISARENLRDKTRVLLIIRIKIRHIFSRWLA